ncbi:3681_t:CDS:2, partial [Entrophospora sp. SA101]
MERVSDSAKSLASSFRKGSYARKPDFCFLSRVAGTIQEILYEETSSPFINLPNKILDDLYKLFQFGHDSEVMMTTELISENIQYLPNYEELWKRLCDVELFLLQTYETKLRVFIMDQPGPPMCRVCEIFDFQIPYNSSDEISVLYFTHGLWKIRL